MDTLNENAENGATEKPETATPADAAAKPAEAAVDQSAESDVEKEADEAKDPEVEELNEDGESVRQQTVQPVECEKFVCSVRMTCLRSDCGISDAARRRWRRSRRRSRVRRTTRGLSRIGKSCATR